MNPLISTGKSTHPLASWIPSTLIPNAPISSADEVLYYRPDQIVREVDAESDHAFMVLHGELIILHNGVPVDLLEPGDLLDSLCWPGAAIITRSHVVLSVVDHADSHEDDYEGDDEIEEYNEDSVRNLLRAIMDQPVYQ